MALMCAASLVFGQIKDDTEWVNDRWSWLAYVDGSTVEMEASAYTPGTQDFSNRTLKKLSDNTYKEEETGWTVKLESHMIYGKKANILLYINEDNQILDVWTQSSSGIGDTKVSPWHDYMLGEFTGPKGETYVFTDAECTINGKKYEWGFKLYGDGYPFSYFYIGDKIYDAIISLNKIILTEYKVTEEDLEEEEPYYNFTEIGNITLTATDKRPRFEFASSNIVYPQNMQLNKDEIRLMRNEIYARHGWTFKSDDLKKYFGSKPWYKPLGDNSKVKLSDLENLNIRILKSIEER